MWLASWMAMVVGLESVVCQEPLGIPQAKNRSPMSYAQHQNSMLHI
jgi:hypothetical protein